MYEICEHNKIEADVFVILAEAGFNLARDLNSQLRPAAIFNDKPNLKSVNHLLSLTPEETKTLIEELWNDYGKEKVQAVGLEFLQSKIAKQKEKLSELTDDEDKEILQTKIDANTKTMHAKMVMAVSSLAKAVAALLGKEEDWANGYIEQTKANEALIERRYQEAVAFAQKSFFNEATANGKKAAGSVKSSKKQSQKG